MDGVEFLRTVRERVGDLPFVLFTARGSEAIASEAVAAGVDEYLPVGGDNDAPTPPTPQTLPTTTRATTTPTRHSRPVSTTLCLGPTPSVE